MLIDRIKKTVETFINTEGRGNFKVEQFNLVLHNALQKRQQDLLIEVNKLVNRENKGLVSNLIDSLPDKFSEKIAHYLTTTGESSVDTNLYLLPSDYAFIDQIESEEGVDFDYCKSNREFNILKTQATSSYPVFTVSNNRIKTSHDLGDIVIHYLRTPKKPKWTYTIFNNNELFNPTATDFVDADVHASEEDEMVYRVLLGFGVNLKEKDLVAFSQSEINNDFNKQNTT